MGEKSEKPTIRFYKEDGAWNYFRFHLAAHQKLFPCKIVAVYQRANTLAAREDVTRVMDNRRNV